MAPETELMGKDTSMAMANVPVALPKREAMAIRTLSASAWLPHQGV
jgi:hypothetical protein